MPITELERESRKESRKEVKDRIAAETAISILFKNANGQHHADPKETEMNYDKISNQHVIEAGNRYMASMFSPTIYWRNYMSSEAQAQFSGIREFLQLVKDRVDYASA
jgi:hypothetical protein